MKPKKIYAGLVILQILYACSPVKTGGFPDGYSGTASVTTGPAETITSNLYPPGQRVTGLGSISTTDGKTWIVPAVTHFADPAFPFAPDLYNMDGIMHESAADALSSFQAADIIEIDPSGQLITGYIFADNYFEFEITMLKNTKLSN